MTNRSFTPVYSVFDNTWSYPNATQLAAIALRADVQSPLAAENDTVAIVADADEDVDSSEDENGEADEETDQMQPMMRLKVMMQMRKKTKV